MIKTGTIILWGERRKRAKVISLYKKAVARIEMPPESGRIYAPLIEDGLNVESWAEENQLSLFDYTKD